MTPTARSGPLPSPEQPMPNQFLSDKLTGIQHTLVALHGSGASMSTASKGQERQDFIAKFLSDVLPRYRFGNGDATDAAGHHSGQLDVVVEYPFAPSLSSLVGGETRLYLAESVAAVIEVKSNVAAQWNEAERTAAQLAPLKRAITLGFTMGESPPVKRIPLFVAGYTGWKTPEVARDKMNLCPGIAGVLVIDSGIFVSSAEYGGKTELGPWSLWGLISCLHAITNSIVGASVDLLAYAS